MNRHITPTLLLLSCWAIVPAGVRAQPGHRWNPVDVTGSWYVAGMHPDQPPATISIPPDSRPGDPLTVTNEEETSGEGRIHPGNRSLTAVWNGRMVTARINRDVLDWGETQWKRVRILGLYFDEDTRTLYEVVTGERGFLSLRVVERGGGPRRENFIGNRPAPVRLLAEDVFEVLGQKAMLVQERGVRGRLVWNDGRTWTGPVWLQGQWLFNGQYCAIWQNGRVLQFQNENGDVANGTIEDPNTITAADWQLTGTLSPNRTHIRWRNATRDVWERVALPGP